MQIHLICVLKKQTLDEQETQILILSLIADHHNTGNCNAMIFYKWIVVYVACCVLEIKELSRKMEPYQLQFKSVIWTHFTYQMSSGSELDKKPHISKTVECMWGL